MAKNRSSRKVSSMRYLDKVRGLISNSSDLEIRRKKLIGEGNPISNLSTPIMKRSALRNSWAVYPLFTIYTKSCTEGARISSYFDAINNAVMPT